MLFFFTLAPPPPLFVGGTGDSTQENLRFPIDTHVYQLEAKIHILQRTYDICILRNYSIKEDLYLVHLPFPVLPDAQALDCTTD